MPMEMSEVDPAIQQYAEQCGIDTSKHQDPNTAIQECFERAMKNGNIIFHFQPVVNAETGECTSGELLMRWKNQEGNLIPPMLYISAIEKNHDLMKKTGAYTVDRACQPSHHGRNAGLHRHRFPSMLLL